MAEYVTPQVTIAATAGDQVLTNATANWTLYKRLPAFDIRNGGVEAVVSLLIKPTIQEMYHWVPIADLAAEDATLAIDGFIRSHLHHINLHADDTVPAVLRRKLAIVLGTIRAVSTAYYRLSDQDLIPGEIASPYLAARKTAEGDLRYVLPTGTATSETLTNPLEFSIPEQTVIAIMIKCGVGVIPMQGYSLVMTAHHYLSDPNGQSRRCFEAAEKALWRGQNLGNWITEDQTILQDAAWHKSTHPVAIHLKQQIAMDETIPKKLKKADAAPCASRLPASEPELRAANSYITCIRTVTRLLTSMNITSDYSLLSQAITAVSQFPVVGPPIMRADLPTVPEHVVDRTSALAYLTEVLVKSQEVAAFCYGFYCTLVDVSQTLGSNTDGQSLKASNSLMKLSSNCFPSYTAGQQFHGDYVACKNKQRQEGLYIVPSLDI